MLVQSFCPAWTILIEHSSSNQVIQVPSKSSLDSCFITVGLAGLGVRLTGGLVVLEAPAAGMEAAGEGPEAGGEELEVAEADILAREGLAGAGKKAVKSRSEMEV